MDIVQIIPNRIYSIRYDGEERAEYYRLFNKEWTDVDFLMAFFQSHPEFTENAFWGFLGNDPCLQPASYKRQIADYIQQLVPRGLVVEMDG